MQNKLTFVNIVNSKMAFLTRTEKSLLREKEENILPVT